VKAIAAHVDHPTGRGIRSRVGGFCHGLVDGPRKAEDYDDA
jgi:hypothetical protein